MVLNRQGGHGRWCEILASRCLTISGDIFNFPNWDRGGESPRIAAKYPMMHRTPPHSKESSSQHVKGAEVKKL